MEIRYKNLMQSFYRISAELSVFPCLTIVNVIFGEFSGPVTVLDSNLKEGVSQQVVPVQNQCCFNHRNSSKIFIIQNF